MPESNQTTEAAASSKPDDTTTTPSSRRRASLTMIFAVIVLTPCMVGFGLKFIELIHAFRSDSTDGAFAITPILNYLLASIGFLCLLAWATFRGMFRDLERPKHDMLEIERELDRPFKLDNPLS